jgi:opacity protein-like surface antigen
MLTTRQGLTGLTALAMLAVTAPAMAQVKAGDQEVSLYAGEMFGDDVTDKDLSGKTPKLDDEFTYGIRYAYSFTDRWALEFSLGETPTAVTDLPTKDIDLDLTTLDVNAVYHFDLGSRWVPYVTAGAGYAIADLDKPIVGTINGTPVSITDDDGYTLNAGAGVKFYANDHFSLRAEARYRYVDSVLQDVGSSLSTVETTLGAAWKF